MLVACASFFFLHSFVFCSPKGWNTKKLSFPFFQVGALTDCEDIINSVNGFEFGPVLEPDEISDSRQCLLPNAKAKKKLRLWKYKRSLKLRWENGKEDLSKKARMALRQLMNWNRRAKKGFLRLFRFDHRRAVKVVEPTKTIISLWRNRNNFDTIVGQWKIRRDSFHDLFRTCRRRCWACSWASLEEWAARQKDARVYTRCVLWVHCAVVISCQFWCGHSWHGPRLGRGDCSIDVDIFDLGLGFSVLLFFHLLCGAKCSNLECKTTRGWASGLFDGWNGETWKMFGAPCLQFYPPISENNMYIRAHFFQQKWFAC